LLAYLLSLYASAPPFSAQRLRSSAAEPTVGQTPSASLTASQYPDQPTDAAYRACQNKMELVYVTITDAADEANGGMRQQIIETGNANQQKTNPNYECSCC
jgi:hypothetical protein